MAVGTVAPAIEHIAQIYQFRKPDEVRAFLNKHPQLLDFLEKTYPEIGRIFGSHALTVFLEHHYDFEDEEESLWIKIMVDLGLDNAAEYLTRFDREWWLKNRSPFFGILGADVEFAPF